MSAQVAITQLPAAGAITGTEAVPIVQNGVTVQTTTGAIAASPSQTYQYLTIVQTPQLPNSRYLSTSSGISLTDGGAQSFYRISLTGTAASLNSAGSGIVVKNTGSTVVNRSIAVSGSGLDVTNANGIAGNPTLALSGVAASVANLSGTGMLALTGSGTTVTGRTLAGTTNQIDVANADGSASAPVFSIASNPVLPGSGGVVVPAGTTAQQPVGTVGQIRYNTDTNTFDAYSAAGWNSFSPALGVTSFSAGTTGLTPTTPAIGAVVLGGVLSVANGGTNSSSTPTAGGVPYGTGTAYAFTAQGTAGQVLTSTGTGAPVWSDINGGTF